MWPEPPAPARPEDHRRAIERGYLLCGTPDEVVRAARQAYAASASTSSCSACRTTLSHDEALECIELFGKQVIPEFDKDPVHRTTRMRQTAKPKYARFENEPPDIETIFTRED